MCGASVASILAMLTKLFQLTQKWNYPSKLYYNWSNGKINQRSTLRVDECLEAWKLARSERILSTRNRLRRTPDASHKCHIPRCITEFLRNRAEIAFYYFEATVNSEPLARAESIAIFLSGGKGPERKRERERDGLFEKWDALLRSKVVLKRLKKCRQWETINLAGSRTRHLFPSLFHPPSSSPLPAPPGHPFALTIWKQRPFSKIPLLLSLSSLLETIHLLMTVDEHVIDSNCTNRTIYFVFFCHQLFSSYRIPNALRDTHAGIVWRLCTATPAPRRSTVKPTLPPTFYTLLPKNFFPFFSNFDFDREDRLERDNEAPGTGTNVPDKCPKGDGQFAVFIGNLKIYGNQESVWCLNGETSVQASKQARCIGE